MRLLCIILIIFFIPHYLFSQADLSDANTNYDDENYEVALKQFLKNYKNVSNNPEVNYKIGVCYLKTNFNKKAALTYLLKADSLKPGAYKDIYFLIAQAYYHSLKFEQAEEYLQKYSTIQKLKPDELAQVDKLYEYINNAKNAIKKPVNVTFINLGKTINSPQDDYIPFITEDENLLFFTSSRKYISDYQQFVKGVYFSKKTNGIWSAANSVSSKINTDENEEIVGISKDGNTLLVHVDRLSNPHDIFYSEKKPSNVYGELVDFGPNINSKYEEIGATLTITGDTMYFASNRPGGKGGFDIYMSFRRPDNTWSPAINIGEPINSEADENYPYITADGKTLYFCSNGRNTIGGYDIYKSTLNDDGTWSEPENLGYPVNDTYDNYNIALTSNKRYGYISKYDENSIGGFDIYRVIFNDVPPTNIVYTGNILVGDKQNAVPYKQVDSLIAITLYNKTNPTQNFIFQPNKKGRYTIALTPGEWVLEIKGKAYEDFSKEYSIRDEQPSQTVFFEDIYLRKKQKK